jgi:hypothetical protein
MDEREAKIREDIESSVKLFGPEDCANSDLLYLLSLLDEARVELADEQRRAEKLLSEENLQARWTLEAQDEVRRLREEMRHVDKDTYR